MQKIFQNPQLPQLVRRRNDVCGSETYQSFRVSLSGCGADVLDEHARVMQLCKTFSGELQIKVRQRKSHDEALIASLFPKFSVTVDVSELSLRFTPFTLATSLKITLQLLQALQLGTPTRRHQARPRPAVSCANLSPSSTAYDAPTALEALDAVTSRTGKALQACRQREATRVCEAVSVDASLFERLRSGVDLVANLALARVSVLVFPDTAYSGEQSPVLDVQPLLALRIESILVDAVSRAFDQHMHASMKRLQVLDHNKVVLLSFHGSAEPSKTTLLCSKPPDDNHTGPLPALMLQAHSVGPHSPLFPSAPADADICVRVGGPLEVAVSYDPCRALLSNSDLRNCMNTLMSAVDLGHHSDQEVPTEAVAEVKHPLLLTRLRLAAIIETAALSLVWADNRVELRIQNSVAEMMTFRTGAIAIHRYNCDGMSVYFSDGKSKAPAALWLSVLPIIEDEHEPINTKVHAVSGSLILCRSAGGYWWATPEVNKTALFHAKVVTVKYHYSVAAADAFAGLVRDMGTLTSTSSSSESALPVPKTEVLVSMRLERCSASCQGSDEGCKWLWHAKGAGTSLEVTLGLANAPEHLAENNQSADCSVETRVDSVVPMMWRRHMQHLQWSRNAKPALSDHKAQQPLCIRLGLPEITFVIATEGGPSALLVTISNSSGSLEGFPLRKALLGEDRNSTGDKECGQHEKPRLSLSVGALILSLESGQEKVLLCALRHMPNAPMPAQTPRQKEPRLWDTMNIHASCGQIGIRYFSLFTLCKRVSRNKVMELAAENIDFQVSHVLKGTDKDVDPVAGQVWHAATGSISVRYGTFCRKEDVPTMTKKQLVSPAHRKEGVCMLHIPAKGDVLCSVDVSVWPTLCQVNFCLHSRPDGSIVSFSLPLCKALAAAILKLRRYYAPPNRSPTESSLPVLPTSKEESPESWLSRRQLKLDVDAHIPKLNFWAADRNSKTQQWLVLRWSCEQVSFRSGQYSTEAQRQNYKLQLTASHLVLVAPPVHKSSQRTRLFPSVFETGHIGLEPDIVVAYYDPFDLDAGLSLQQASVLGIEAAHAPTALSSPDCIPFHVERITLVSTAIKLHVGSLEHLTPWLQSPGTRTNTAPVRTASTSNFLAEISLQCSTSPWLRVIDGSTMDFSCAHMSIAVSLLEQPGCQSICNIADRRSLGMWFKLQNLRFDAKVTQTPFSSTTQHPCLKIVMKAECAASWSLLCHLDSYEVVQRTRFRARGEMSFRMLGVADEDADSHDVEEESESQTRLETPPLSLCATIAAEECLVVNLRERTLHAVLSLVRDSQTVNPVPPIQTSWRCDSGQALKVFNNTGALLWLRTVPCCGSNNPEGEWIPCEPGDPTGAVIVVHGGMDTAHVPREAFEVSLCQRHPGRQKVQNNSVIFSHVDMHLVGPNVSFPTLCTSLSVPQDNILSQQHLSAADCIASLVRLQPCSQLDDAKSGATEEQYFGLACSTASMPFAVLTGQPQPADNMSTVVCVTRRDDHIQGIQSGDVILDAVPDTEAQRWTRLSQSVPTPISLDELRRLCRQCVDRNQGLVLHLVRAVGTSSASCRSTQQTCARLCVTWRGSLRELKFDSAIVIENRTDACLQLQMTGASGLERIIVNPDGAFEMPCLQLARKTWWFLRFRVILADKSKHIDIHPDAADGGGWSVKLLLEDLLQGRLLVPKHDAMEPERNSNSNEGNVSQAVCTASVVGFHTQKNSEGTNRTALDVRFYEPDADTKDTEATTTTDQNAISVRVSMRAESAHSPHTLRVGCLAYLKNGLPVTMLVRIVRRDDRAVVQSVDLEPEATLPLYFVDARYCLQVARVCYPSEWSEIDPKNPSISALIDTLVENKQKTGPNTGSNERFFVQLRFSETKDTTPLQLQLHCDDMCDPWSPLVVLSAPCVVVDRTALGLDCRLFRLGLLRPAGKPATKQKRKPCLAVLGTPSSLLWRSAASICAPGKVAKVDKWRNVTTRAKPLLARMVGEVVSAVKSFPQRVSYNSPPGSPSRAKIIPLSSTAVYALPSLKASVGIAPIGAPAHWTSLNVRDFTDLAQTDTGDETGVEQELIRCQTRLLHVAHGTAATAVIAVSSDTSKCSALVLSAPCALVNSCETCLSVQCRVTWSGVSEEIDSRTDTTMESSTTSSTVTSTMSTLGNPLSLTPHTARALFFEQPVAFTVKAYRVERTWIRIRCEKCDDQSWSRWIDLPLDASRHISSRRLYCSIPREGAVPTTLMHLRCDVQICNTETDLGGARNVLISQVEASDLPYGVRNDCYLVRVDVMAVSQSRAVALLAAEGTSAMLLLPPAYASLFADSDVPASGRYATAGPRSSAHFVAQDDPDSFCVVVNIRDIANGELVCGMWQAQTSAVAPIRLLINLRGDLHTVHIPDVSLSHSRVLRFTLLAQPEGVRVVVSTDLADCSSPSDRSVTNILHRIVRQRIESMTCDMNRAANQQQHALNLTNAGYEFNMYPIGTVESLCETTFAFSEQNALERARAIIHFISNTDAPCNLVLGQFLASQTVPVSDVDMALVRSEFMAHYIAPLIANQFEDGIIGCLREMFRHFDLPILDDKGVDRILVSFAEHIRTCAAGEVNAAEADPDPAPAQSFWGSNLLKSVTAIGKRLLYSPSDQDKPLQVTRVAALSTDCLVSLCRRAIDLDAATWGMYPEYDVAVSPKMLPSVTMPLDQFVSASVAMVPEKSSLDTSCWTVIFTAVHESVSKEPVLTRRRARFDGKCSCGCHAPLMVDDFSSEIDPDPDVEDERALEVLWSVMHGVVDASVPAPPVSFSVELGALLPKIDLSLFTSRSAGEQFAMTVTNVDASMSVNSEASYRLNIDTGDIQIDNMQVDPAPQCEVMLQTAEHAVEEQQDELPFSRFTVHASGWRVFDQLWLSFPRNEAGHCVQLALEVSAVYQLAQLRRRLRDTMRQQVASHTSGPLFQSLPSVSPTEVHSLANPSADPPLLHVHDLHVGALTTLVCTFGYEKSTAAGSSHAESSPESASEVYAELQLPWYCRPLFALKK